jgi:hypothetical protein
MQVLRMVGRGGGLGSLGISCSSDGVWKKTQVPFETALVLVKAEKIACNLQDPFIQIMTDIYCIYLDSTRFPILDDIRLRMFANKT